MTSQPHSRPLRIAVTGSSGLIGSLLVPTLIASGHSVTRLVRRTASRGEIGWDPDGAGVDPGALTDIEAVVHLAGENIAKVWSLRRKRAILESRRKGTRVLAEAMARAQGPKVLVSASAIGYYGDRGDQMLTEQSGPGLGFLPDVVVAWEMATEPAEAAGIRVVRIRIGLPLTARGGLLGKVLLPFRMGLGGRMGSGRQWMSWIGSMDLIDVFHLALSRDSIRGAVNAVGPEPVRNSEFARELGRLLKRPAKLPLPAFALKAAFGQMARETILASARVIPEVLQGASFRFRHATLGEALSHELGLERKPD
jgi:uncharacterized protein (TIGR01777 family)